jgi:alanyl-tRNA synthetase
MHKLVPVIVESMGGAFPELKKKPNRVVELIRDEEVSFGKTLDRGIQLFESAAVSGKITANDAFKLHDTYGFPIDLTQIMAVERGMTVDIAGYEKLMEEARELARAGGKTGDSAIHELPPAVLAELAQNGLKPTNDSAKFSLDPIRARVVAIWNGSNLDPSADTSSDQEIAIILDRTNFYAEMGGQVGDSGMLSSATMQFDVESTHVFGGYVLHVGRVGSGTIRIGDEVTATLAPSRKRTMQNHTATHLANWALREVLGDDVQQKGSLVDPQKLRFDFSHGKSMSDDELVRVERLVNESIAKKFEVYAEEAPQQDALKISGLRAVFGEKYPPLVRVVSIGSPVSELLKNPANEKWRQFSVEFCGGTHLGNSADVDSFVITAEESVSKGVRRIVAHTGESARGSFAAERELELAVIHAEKMPETQLPAALNAIQKHLAGEGIPLRAKRRALGIVSLLQSKHKAWEKSQKSSGGAMDVAAVATGLLDKGKIVVASIDGASDDQLRAVIDSIKKRTESFAAMLGATDGQKVSFVAAVSDDIIAKGLKAGDWIRETAKVAGGGGGGRPQMAQAGGKDPSKLAEALDVARKYAAERAGS